MDSCESRLLEQKCNMTTVVRVAAIAAIALMTIVVAMLISSTEVRKAYINKGYTQTTLPGSNCVVWVLPDPNKK